VEVVIEADGVAILDIEHRTKSVESFVQKINRKGQKYADPIQEMTDLAGIRVITYYVEDLERVAAVIDRELAIDWSNSMNPAQSMEPERFGTRLRHMLFPLAPIGSR
jgi:putative GTP pyrophosphokinase